VFASPPSVFFINQYYSPINVTKNAFNCNAQSNVINLTKLNYRAAIIVHDDINSNNIFLSQVININLTHKISSLVCFRSFLKQNTGNFKAETLSTCSQNFNAIGLKLFL